MPRNLSDGRSNVGNEHSLANFVSLGRRARNGTREEVLHRQPFSRRFGREKSRLGNLRRGRRTEILNNYTGTEY